MFLARFFESRSHETQPDNNVQHREEDKHEPTDEKLQSSTGQQATGGFFDPLKDFLLAKTTEEPERLPLGKAQPEFAAVLNRLWDKLEGEHDNTDNAKKTDTSEGLTEGEEKKINDKTLKKERKCFPVDTVLNALLGLTVLEDAVEIDTIDLEGNSYDVLYHSAEVLLKAVKKQEEKTKNRLEELQSIQVSEISKVVKEEALQDVVAFNRTAAELKTLINVVGTSSIGKMLEKRSETSLSEPLLRLQVLMIARHYISALKRCLEVLENAQHLLSRQCNLECLKSLSPLPQIFKTYGKENGKWIFSLSTREYIGNKLGFILEILIEHYSRTLHHLLEEIGWGTSKLSVNVSIKNMTVTSVYPIGGFRRKLN